MNLIDFIYLDLSNWYISVFGMFLVLFLMFILYFFKHHFVVPFSKVFHFRFISEKLLLFVILIILFILPLNPSLIWDRVEEVENVSNIQILFDVSLSMVVDDMKPSRFKVAKDSLYEFVDSLHWYNIWIIIYSWIPFNWLPFTTETNAVLSKIDDFNLSEFPPTMSFVWTAVWDAIYLGLDNLFRLYWEGSNPWSIILITDWDTNKWTDPEQAAKYADALWIPIYWIWIWKTNQNVWTDSRWLWVAAKFNFSLLEDIISHTDWKAYHVTSSQELQEVFDSIKNEIKENEVVVYKNEIIPLSYYLYFILSILITILVLIRFSSIY